MKIPKKNSLESVETLFSSQKKHSDVILNKKLRKLLNILKYWSKTSSRGLKAILRPKSDSKDWEWKFPKSMH